MCCLKTHYAKQPYFQLWKKSDGKAISVHFYDYVRETHFSYTKILNKF